MPWFPAPWLQRDPWARPRDGCTRDGLYDEKELKPREPRSVGGEPARGCSRQRHFIQDASLHQHPRQGSAELRQSAPSSRGVWEGERSVGNHLRAGGAFRRILNTEIFKVMLFCWSFSPFPFCVCCFSLMRLWPRNPRGRWPSRVEANVRRRHDWQGGGAGCVVRMLGAREMAHGLVFCCCMSLYV